MSAHPQPAPGSFVLSLPRTGSTLLRLVLDTHPEVYAPDELDLGRLAGSLFTTLGGLEELRGQSSPTARLRDGSDDVTAEIRRIVSDLMDRHTSAKGKKTWCEKSPWNLDRMDLLKRVFPDARFILLHRHALDTAISCIDSAASVMGFSLPIVERYVARDPHDFVTATVKAWVEMSEKLLRFEDENPEHSMRLRYEDLVTDPAGRFEELCAFLGVSHQPDVLERVFSAPHHQRTGRGDNKVMFSTGISQDRLGQGRRIPWHRVGNLPGDLFLALNRTLERLGYPAVTGPDWEVGVAGAQDAGRKEPEPAAGESAGPPEVGFKELFETRLATRLAGGLPEVLKGASYRFVVQGEGGGDWLLDMAGERGRVVPGGDGHGSETAPCTIKVSGGELLKILRGEQHPVQAQLEGKLQVVGSFDVQALQALLMLFKG